MFSSIKIGVRHVASDRFFISLGDMPAISPSIYARIASITGCDAVRPTFQGNKGHPVLLSRRLVDKILELDDSRSMSEVLRGSKLVELPVDDPLVAADVDTQADYERLARLGREQFKTERQ